jgi:transposase
MNNAPIHTPLKIYELAENESISACIFPYSPFLNRIEKSWSKVKTGARRNALTADDRLSDRICDSVQVVIRADCQARIPLLCHSFQDANKKISTCEKTEGLFRKLFRSSCNAYTEK